MCYAANIRRSVGRRDDGGTMERDVECLNLTDARVDVQPCECGNLSLDLRLSVFILVSEIYYHTYNIQIFLSAARLC